MFSTILAEKATFANETFPIDSHSYDASQNTQIYIVYFNCKLYENKCRWDLVTDPVEAFQIDPDYKLASINDLHDYVAAGGEVFEGIVKVKEGLYKWFEMSTMTEDMLEDHICEYRSVI